MPLITGPGGSSVFKLNAQLAACHSSVKTVKLTATRWEKNATAMAFKNSRLDAKVTELVDQVVGLEDSEKFLKVWWCRCTLSNLRRKQPE
jgi:hypothetical protein